jgi:undecaprenol kinase
MFSLKRLRKSFKYAVKGLIKIFKEEQNLRVQLFAGLSVLFLGAILGINRMEWALLTISISLVLVMEAVNSAIERVADALKPRLSGYIKEVKDIMAAAVLIASLSAVIIGIIIYYPYLADFIGK